jgi:hypothetical protein
VGEEETTVAITTRNQLTNPIRPTSCLTEVWRFDCLPQPPTHINLEAARQIPASLAGCCGVLALDSSTTSYVEMTALSESLNLSAKECSDEILIDPAAKMVFRGKEQVKLSPLRLRIFQYLWAARSEIWDNKVKPSSVAIELGGLKPLLRKVSILLKTDGACIQIYELPSCNKTAINMQL